MYCTLIANKNFDSFYEYFQSFEKTPEIICLSETHIRDKALINLEILSYLFIHSNSVTCAVGVGIYISDKCKYLSSDEALQFTLDKCENQWITIYKSESSKAKAITIGVI